MTSVPTATRIVVPFSAGVTVIVPCAVLGADGGGLGCGAGGDETGRGGVGEEDAGEEGGAGGVGGADEVGPPEAEPLGELESEVVAGPVPAP
ncbi:hypothetical protein ABH926_000092 [Catenulispora sp. GP43]